MKRTRFLVGVWLLVLVLAWLPISPALAGPGDLDTTFDSDGKVLTDLPGTGRGLAVAIQPNGKIVVAGYVADDFAVARYNVDGSLDTTGFGAPNGYVITDLGDTEEARAVAIDRFGGIVVAGFSGDKLAVARYTADGVLDLGFGAPNGYVTTDFGGEAEGRAVAIQPDGKIVVAGNANVGGNTGFAVARYLAWGELDDSFDEDGLVTTHVAATGLGYGVAIQPDGMILIAGTATTSGDSDFALIRYETDGDLDAGFGTGGQVTTDFGSNGDWGYALAVQADGKIAVVGSTQEGANADFAVARYESGGELDTSFGGDGLVITDFGNPVDVGQGVAFLPDGKIVVAGYSKVLSGNSDFAVACYDSEGELDSGFGSGGQVTTDFTGWGTSLDEGHALALQGEKIVVVGRVLGSGDVALARYDYGAPPGTFLVNTTVDERDDSCTDGDCSLRDAMLLANADPGPNTIHFLIPGDWVHRILPAVALPAMTGGGTTIDGYSQPGAAEATATTPAELRIEIDGALVAAQNGFNVVSADNAVRGLAIHSFPWNGVYMAGGAATGNLIAGNWIGLFTGSGGMGDSGNDYDGVYIALGAKDNTVGGDDPGARNVIGDNNWSGVEIHGADTSGNVVSGNYIGTYASGMADLGNTLYGVRIYAGAHDNTVSGNLISGNDLDGVRLAGANTVNNVVSGNLIGPKPNGIEALANGGNGVTLTDGTADNTVGPDNLISANAQNGVALEASGNTISGNQIGTDIEGTGDLGNGSHGVVVGPGSAGDTVGPGNVIAYNGGDGVNAEQAGGATFVTQNSIFANDGLGILPASPAPDAPAIDAAAPGSLLISGAACAGCTVEVFASAEPDGEGQVYLGSDTADGGSFELSIASVPYLYLTATATDEDDGTSAFSPVFTVTLPILTVSSKTVNRDMVAPGGTLTYTLTLSNTGTVAAPATLSDTLPAEVTWLGDYTASSGTLTWDGANNRLLWSGTVGLEAPVTIIFGVEVNGGLAADTVISNTATLDDGYGAVHELGPATTTVVTYKTYLPTVLRSHGP